MPIGTLVNVVTVLGGSVAGTLIGSRIPGRLRETILGALGLVVLALAVRETLATDEFVIVLAAVLVGAIIGELLRIEQGLERLGTWLQERLTGTASPIDVELPEAGGGELSGAAGVELPVTAGAAGDRRFATGFVISSLVFCIGPLTVLGSIQDGLGDPELLIIKAGLDGFAAIAFAAVYGWGVALSAAVVLVVQGGIALFAGALDSVLTEPMVDVLASAGGVLIFGIGLRLLDLKHLRVANMLPALVVGPLLIWWVG